jgi:anti-sigma factor RsiW
MMSHQPFETWNLNRSSLTPDQKAELQRHLETCPVCKPIYTAWECAQQDLKSTKQVKAPAGFATRFQYSLEDRRRRAHRHQVRKILTIMGLSLLLILILFMIYTMAQTSPAAWIGSAIRVIVDAPFNFLEVRFIASFWLSRIPPLAWAAVSLILSAWVAVLLVTGTLTYKRFRHQGETIR